MYYIVGLGNPGEEYKMTRHNTGRMVVEDFTSALGGSASGGKKNKSKDFEFDKKINALVSEVKIKKEKILLVLPETFMNNSGDSVQKIVTSKKKAKNLIVIHDDLDLPLGKFQISFAKSSAGHRGVESVIKKIKTEKFIRIRVGTCPKKKPAGKELIKFLMGNFASKEIPLFKKTSQKIATALETIIGKGLQRAMSQYN